MDIKGRAVRICEVGSCLTALTQLPTRLWLQTSLLCSKAPAAYNFCVPPEAPQFELTLLFVDLSAGLYLFQFPTVN